MALYTVCSLGLMNSARFGMSGCSVVRDKRHNIKGVTWFWQQLSHPTETRFDQIICEKSNKAQLCLLCCGVCRGNGNLWITFKFEVFYSDSEVSVTHCRCGFLIYRHSPVASSGPGSSVGIATVYELAGRGIEFRWRRDFPHLSIPALGPT